MTLKSLLAAGALGLAALPAFAQSTVPGSPALPPTQELPTDRGYDKPSARVDAVNAAEAPVTAQLNGDSGAAATVRSAADQAQYDADRDAYWAALVEHDRAVQRTDERWVRQQNAYADAMTAWRFQVAECKRGKRKACALPTPTPDQFY